MVAELASNADIAIALDSLELTVIVLLIHNRSPWLCFMGFLPIIVAVPHLTLATPSSHTILNMDKLCVASAIGADDIFIVVDKWNNGLSSSPKEAAKEDMAEVALPDAACAKLFTTITASVAFFAKCSCVSLFSRCSHEL